MKNNFFGNNFTFNVQKPRNEVKFDKTLFYDFLIIGGGPSGLNAALYAKRKGLKVGIVTYDIGGQLLNTTGIDNYLGFKETEGATLANSFLEQVENLAVPILKEVKVTKIVKEGENFILHLDDKSQLKSKTLLIATGGKSRKLNIPGEERLQSKNLSYCAVCDAPFYKGLDVVVAGGGNSAVEAVLDLAHYANKITLIQRSHLRADQILIDKMNLLEKVSVMLETQILEVHGEEKVEGLTILDKASQKTTYFPTNGLFIEIGVDPLSGFVEGLLALNEKQEIIVNERQETSVPGIYASGDVTNTPHKQIIIAASEGAKAALQVSDYLNRQK